MHPKDGKEVMSEQERRTALTRRDEAELQQIRRRGELDAARMRETKLIAKEIEGIQFGTVQGSALSPGTRWAVAEFCRVTGANPALHLYVFGGRPYLSEDYWADLINTNPLFIEYRQREVGPGAERAVREKAEQLRALASEAHEKAEEFGDATLRQKAATLTRDAIDLDEEAADMAVQRAQFGAPDWATHVVVTEIDRFIESTPLDAVKAGQVSREPWVKTVSECNWCGGRNGADGKKDPIGDAEPGKTSRTRSLRRCAEKGFAAWMDQYREQQSRAEEALEADWEIIAEEAEERDSLALGSGPQVVSMAGGEPAAGSGPAMEIPEEGQAPSRAPARSSEAAETSEEPEPEGEEQRVASPIDIERRAYFANLRDRGVTVSGDREEDQQARYAWQKEQGLPESTRDWDLGQWREANSVLTAQERLAYRRACNDLGADHEAFAEGHLGRQPTMIRDYEDLLEKLALADEPSLAQEALL